MNEWIARIKRLFAIPAQCDHGLTHGKLFVQADGTTDLSRVLGAFVVLGYLAYEGYALIALKQPFQASDFGQGAAAITGGVAVLILGHNFASR